jgi:hypothetical protein
MIQIVDSWRANGRSNGSKPCVPIPAKWSPILDTGITDAIEKVLPQVEGKFNWIDIKTLLTRDGYEIRSKNPRTSISRVLHNFVMRQVLDVVENGSGGSPSVYIKR